jgi:hypothetical protein
VLGKKQVLRVSVDPSLLSTRLTYLVAELQVHHDAWLWLDGDLQLGSHLAVSFYVLDTMLLN